MQPSLALSRMFTQSLLPLLTVLAGFSVSGVNAFDNSRSDNVAVYWGQNSYGVGHPSDSANWQQKLAFYCQDDSIDAIPIAFMDVFFGAGGVPSINLANICSDQGTVFPGTDLPDCSFLASDIQTCQAKGKIVTISMGGQTGAGAFASAQAASDYADLIWNIFLGGTSSTRPFGAAVLDGIDLDIEGGSTTNYDSFVKQLQTHFSTAPKKYYVTAVLNAASFDAIYVQFYNNYCSLPNYNNAADWDYASWDTWAKTQSINKDVKVYIGAPAATSAANPGMYVDVNTLGSIAVATRNQYSSFGGVMLWDASQAYMNSRYDAAIKGLIKNSSGGSTTTTSHTTTTTSTSQTSTTTTSTSTSKTSTSTTSTSTTSSGGGTGNCATAAAWVNNLAYNGGATVTYNGHLWLAKWWSYGSTPGGSAGDWTDEGACTMAKDGVYATGSKVGSSSIPSVVPTSSAEHVKRMRVYRD